MPNVGSVFQGGAAGAGIGWAVGGPVGAGIGAGIGLLGGLFGGGDDPEEISAERFREYLKFLSEEKKKEIATTMPALAKMTSGLIQQASAGATRRATAEGDVASKESYVLPAVSRVARAGSDTQAKALMDIEGKYSSAAMGMAGQYAMRPQEATAWDYLMEVAPSVSGMINMNKIYSAMQKNPSNSYFNKGGNTDTFDPDTMKYMMNAFNMDQESVNEMFPSFKPSYNPKPVIEPEVF